MRSLCIPLVFLLAGSTLAGSPAEAVAAAAKDLATIPVGVQPYTRYLSLYAVVPSKRPEFIKVLNFHLNSLSTEAEFPPLRLVTSDLIAINYAEYGWDPSVWEKLVSADPYFHQKLKLPEDALVKTIWPGSKEYKAGVYKEFKKKGTLIDSAGPWLPTRDIIALRERCYTEVPILRADWFINQTGIQADRVAGYYDFLGLGKKEADFERLIGADQKESRRVKKEIAASLAKSGVTLQNRGIVRFQAITGAYWLTQDFKKSVDRQNVLRLLDLDRDPPAGDASERYGTLPNGLFVFWLQNSKGERQDSAPDFIASDGVASGTDRRVHIGKSCITCHVEGIRPIDDYIRRIYRGAVKLQDPDYEKFLRKRQLYFSDLERQVKKDQAEYAERLFLLCGMKPAEVAKSYNRVWDAYTELDLGPTEVAREVGMREADLLAGLKKYASPPPVGGGAIDVVIAGLLQEPPVPIRREHFEEIYGTLQAAIRGTSP